MPIGPASAETRFPGRRQVMAGLAALLAVGPALRAAGAAAQTGPDGLALYMFERAGCPYCAQWHREVGPAYPVTPEGAAAPLIRVDLRKGLPAGLVLERMPQFTPTFVLVRDGTEIGRIEGYTGNEFFWHRLEQMISGAASQG